MDGIYKMSKNCAGLLLVGNYSRYYLFTVLLCLITCDAQIIRKSIELPVKDYLSGPKNERGNRDAKNYFYTMGEKIDSVRGFEVMSPHTPATALLSAVSKINDVQTGNAFSTTPTLLNHGNVRGDKLLNLFSPTSSSKGHANIDKIRRSSSPSIKLMEDGLNKIEQGYSFSYSTPSSLFSDRGPDNEWQTFVPIHSTPSSVLYHNDDASLEHNDKFQPNSYLAKESPEYYTNANEPLHSTWTPLELKNKHGRDQEYDNPTYSTVSNPRHEESGEYFPQHRESQDYYENTQDIKKDKKLSKEQFKESNPSINRAQIKNKLITSNSENPQESNRYNDMYVGKIGKLPYQPVTIATKLPNVPPTIGVIGLKSNSDLDTRWKPSQTLMDMTDQHIKEDLMKEGYEMDKNKPNKINENSQNYNMKNTEGEESSEDDESSDDEESEEEEEEEESSDEEEDSTQSQEQEITDDDKKSIPLEYPPKYSEEQFEERPHHSSEFNEETLPPGPPYYPSSFPQDERSKVGYLIPPTVNYGPDFFGNTDGNVQQTWTPIIPKSKPYKLIVNDNSPNYRHENSPWLSERDRRSKENFPNNDSSGRPWNSFSQSESPSERDEIRNHNDYTKSHRLRGRKVGPGNRPMNDYSEERAEESKELIEEQTTGRGPVENDGYKSDEESPEVQSHYSDYSPRPPVTADSVEVRERSRVSDHEIPRKIPTRLRYPGGGLWAKPAPDSGIELGFVPKKVYTQTRRFNTVKHLPREAAIAQATTAEEMVNAPRLREVVSHKKIQEVYEEEGYEDAGYDHGGYKKHGASKEDNIRHDAREHLIPESDEAPSEEEAFNEHVAHLDEIPENTDSDPAGQSSANKQVVQQKGENPKIKGSWKQQKVTTNGKTMAFLDEEGKGGILTQIHKPQTEGVIGKYLDVNGETVPVLQKIPNKYGSVFKGAISTQSFIPLDKQQSDGEGDTTFKHDTLIPKMYNSGHSEYPRENAESIDMPYSNYKMSSRQLNPHEEYIIKNKSYPDGKVQLHNSNNYEPSRATQTDRSKRMKIPKIKEYVSRNNRFSFPTPMLQNNLYHTEKANVATNLDSTEKYSANNIHLNANPGEVNVASHVTNHHNTVGPSSKLREQIGDTYHSNLRPRHLLNGEITTPAQESYLYDNPTSSEIKERKSRDLTAFGIDKNSEVISDSEFTHPTVAFKAIEHQMSSISSESNDTPLRKRQSFAAATGDSKKYKEIVRNTDHQHSETEGRREKSINVNLMPHDLNIRHPFLPKDGSGDVPIDYVYPRTRVQPDEPPPRRQSSDDVELSSVIEDTITSTTPRVTSARIKTTTEEYVPEDPIKSLSRLKSNPFLLSVFPGQENAEDKRYHTSESYSVSTTTPKITTYRAKPAMDDTTTKETPEQTLQRLKENPFLSSVFLSRSSKNEGNRNIDSKRNNRIKPIIVLPDTSDIAVDSSVKHVEKLTLAQFSGPSENKYKDIPINSQHRMTKLARQLNTDGVTGFHIVVRRSADTDEPQAQSVNVAAVGTTTEIPVDAEKYPFYYSAASVTLPKNSPLRYATNPKDIPIKNGQGMEFYESRDKAVNCEEPSPPKDIVPKRDHDGEWNKNPQPGKQRLGKLGDQIDCLKMKYFGEDPLDNPFFKEDIIGLLNLKKESPKDTLGQGSEIIQDIKSVTPNNYEPTKGVIFKDQTESIPLKLNKEVKNNSNSYSKHKYSSSYVREYPIKLNESAEESKIIPTRVSHSYSVNEATTPVDKSVKHIRGQTGLTDKMNTTIQVPPLTEVQRGASGPIGLHPPKNVIISFRSKGTSNHPKIRLLRTTNSLYNFNVNILPMGTVGYLKSHEPIHVPDRPKTILVPISDNPEPVIILDDVSNKASKIAKHKKYPTSVSYLTLDQNGKLLHQHIRTFVPVRSASPNHETQKHLSNLPNNATFNGWNRQSTDIRRGEPKYRRKRSNENDKYINSKESMELKRFLLQKYAEILAKEKAESSTQNTNRKETTTENIPAKTANPTSGRKVGVSRVLDRPLYSSRYSAHDPMRGSSSTDVEVGDEGPAQTQSPTKRYPTRQPKVRFPKLHMNLRAGNDPNKSKLLNLPEVHSVKPTSTTTTTTTEPPPSTTTRMYKPRVVYRKEYGKPLNRVGNMFAILRQRPLAVESTTAHTTTENISETTENYPIILSPPRRLQPKRLHQLEHRRVTKEEVFRKTYHPTEEASERSDGVGLYDTPGFDHPDLRAPVLRTSRGTSDDEYHEMLVYMVNPMTGLGEWKMMPVPVRAISRMDEEDYLVKPKLMKPRKKNVNARMANVDINNLETSSEESTTTNREGDFTNSETGDTIHSTIPQKKSKTKSRRKHNNRRQRNMKLLKSSDEPRSTPEAEDATLTTLTTPSQQTSSEGSEGSTSSESAPTPTTTLSAPSTSSRHPKIIMEPHKRKYFYAKI